MNEILKSCINTSGEIAHFNNILELLGQMDIPDRLWEEQSTTSACKHKPYSRKCLQIVLGRQYQTQEYIACPDFLVLNIADWSIEKNDMFIEQITRPYQKIANRPICDKFPIRLCHNTYPKHYLDGNQTKIVPGSVTTREICLLKIKGFYFYQPKGKDYWLLSRYPNLKVK